MVSPGCNSSSAEAAIVNRWLQAIAIYAVLLALSFASLIPTRHVTVKDRNGGVLAHVRDRVYLSQAVRETALDTWYPVDSDAPASTGTCTVVPPYGWLSGAGSIGVPFSSDAKNG